MEHLAHALPVDGLPHPMGYCGSVCAAYHPVFEAEEREQRAETCLSPGSIAPRDERTSKEQGEHAAVERIGQDGVGPAEGRQPCRHGGMDHVGRRRAAGHRTLGARQHADRRQPQPRPDLPAESLGRSRTVQHITEKASAAPPALARVRKRAGKGVRHDALGRR